MIITAPDLTEAPGPSVFVAGSIEMGAAVDWQEEAVKLLDAAGLVVYNPRRRDWDSSWEQSLQNDQFRRQVLWEQRRLLRVDAAVINFVPGTKSPISLLELGLLAGRAFYDPEPPFVVVICPDGFWRKGNVDVMRYAYGLKQASTVESACSMVKKALEQRVKEENAWLKASW